MYENQQGKQVCLIVGPIGRPIGRLIGQLTGICPNGWSDWASGPIGWSEWVVRLGKWSNWTTDRSKSLFVFRSTIL